MNAWLEEHKRQKAEFRTKLDQLETEEIREMLVSTGEQTASTDFVCSDGLKHPMDREQMINLAVARFALAGWYDRLVASFLLGDQT